MEGQSPLRKQAKFSPRILCSSRRILRFPMLNKHPAGSDTGKETVFTRANAPNSAIQIA